MIKQIEYIDWQNHNTVCVAEFTPVQVTDVLEPGTKCVTYDCRDGKTLYPVLLTVDRVISPGYPEMHVKMEGWGSWTYILVWKMSNP